MSFRKGVIKFMSGCFNGPLYLFYLMIFNDDLNCLLNRHIQHCQKLQEIHQSSSCLLRIRNPQPLYENDESEADTEVTASILSLS